jgi:hypothetical protein
VAAALLPNGETRGGSTCVRSPHLGAALLLSLDPPPDHEGVAGRSVDATAAAAGTFLAPVDDDARDMCLFEERGSVRLQDQPFYQELR